MKKKLNEVNEEAQIQQAIDEYIQKNGDSFEIYVDYSDELSEDTVKQIFESDHPRDAFYDIIGDWSWWENADYEYDEIIKQLNLPDEIKEDYGDVINDMVRDQISYEIPYDHFDTNVGFDVFLNNPEGANVEYSEELISYEDEDNEESKATGVSSEIALLLQTQGYTVEQFLEYVNSGANENKFFSSLLEEIQNSTYNYGQIVFLGNASILDMAEAIETQGAITIPANAMCGIVETGNGSGSMLDIELEKPISGAIVDKSKPAYQSREGLFDPFYKNGYSYSVDEIFGLVSSSWDADIKVQSKKNESYKERKDMKRKVNETKKPIRRTSRKINEGNYDYDNAWLGFCTNVKRAMASNDMPVEEAINSEVEDLVYTSDIINVWKDMPGNLGSRTSEITDLMLQDISEGALDDADFIENLEESKKPVRRAGRKINEISDKVVDDAEDKLAQKAAKAFVKRLDKPTKANDKKYAKAYDRLSKFRNKSMARDDRHGVTNLKNGRVVSDNIDWDNDRPELYNSYTKHLEKERKLRYKNESLAESIVREAHSTLSMNEGEAGELTTWQFSARGFSKAMLNKQSTFGSANLRCIIHENENGKLVGTVVTDYGMDKATVEEALKKALAENGFRTTAITDLTNLY